MLTDCEKGALVEAFQTVQQARMRMRMIQDLLYSEYRVNPYKVLAMVRDLEKAEETGQLLVDFLT